jgi:acyl-CoA synthetase (AMP-forming)/AMP-acid ligase II
MRGLMQEHPLILSSVLEFAERFHHDVEIVSRNATTDASGALHRYDYRQAARRSCQLANALDRASIVLGDRVASLAWNGHRHFELYYGVSGSGRILHTVNPRLHVAQVRWIINHAQDRILFFDLSFVQLVCDLHAVCPTVERYVALCSEADLPTGTLIPNLVSYETWIARESDRYKWPSLEENTASSLCYTSGTTGYPKGVLYSHRSSVLHAMGIALPDSLNLSATDTILPLVPMFHVNAWGLPYAAAAIGCRLVFPGAQLDGASLFELIEQEGVTMAAGVPTVWQGLLAHVRQNRLRFSTLDRVVVGGLHVPVECSRRSGMTWAST